MEAKIEKMQERFTKDLERTKMNNALEEINSRITDAEQISDLEERMVKVTAAEQNIEEKKSLRDLWDSIKHTSIHTV